MKNSVALLLLCVLITSAAPASSAERQTGMSLERIEISPNLVSTAAPEPLDNELFMEVHTHINEYVEFMNAQGVPVSATKVNQWLLMNKKYFTNQQLMAISEKLKVLDEENYRNLIMVEYKDPVVSLILSVFTGVWGVDRFYIGNVGLGVGKLLTAGGFGVWWLVDLFCIQNATKKVNYKETDEFFALIGK